MAVRGVTSAWNRWWRARAAIFFASVLLRVELLEDKFILLEMSVRGRVRLLVSASRKGIKK